MDIAMLVLTFLAAVTLAGGVVLAFAKPIDAVLSRLVPSELADAWSRCAKFAIFVTSFTGGLRLKELGGLVTSGNAATIDAPQALLEVMKTATGGLNAASLTLLAFFGGALTVYAGVRVYESVRPGLGHPRGGERLPAGRV
ncbi:hypothetical protein EPO15_18090 [bacterium]|nr:MAG: hypothetical protein EPO15_18090 [bacterium]